MKADTLPTLRPPALMRDGEGRLVAIRALSDAALLALGRFLAEEEAELHLAIVQDALAQGVTEDEARALLDLDPEALRLRAEASWAEVLSEMSRRGLSCPELPGSPPRDLAEIEGLLCRALGVGSAGPPVALEAALAARVAVRATGGTMLPLAWVDLMRRHDGLRLGGLRLLPIAEVTSAPPLSGWSIFGISGRGTVLHAVDRTGVCAAWRMDSVFEGTPSGNPGLSASDFVSYLELLLPRAIEAVVRRGT